MGLGDPMKFVELNESPSMRISKVLSILREKYNITVNLESPISDLDQLYEECKIYRNLMENNDRETRESTILIQEAIRIFLSEIAPKRIHKKKAGE